MVMAVNILIKIPMESVKAKPLIKLSLNQKRIIQAIRVVRLPSRIDGHARLNASGKAKS